MVQDKFSYNLIYYLLCFLPLSIIIGPTVSLISIILITILFLIIWIRKNDFVFQNNYLINFFLILFIYLIFNTFLGIEFENSYSRNLGFIRFILLFFAINYLFIKLKNENNIFKFWLIILSILIFDSYYEVVFGANIFGWGDKDEALGPRIISFFKDEAIVGAYLAGFFLIISSNFLNNKNSKYKKVYFLTFFLTSILLIFLTGERSNFLKAIFGASIFLFLSKEITKKNILYILILFSLVITVVLSSSSYLKLDRYSYLINFISIKDGQIEIKDNLYFYLYRSGYHVFSENKIFGVGAKNYRKYSEKRSKELRNTEDKNKFIIDTHPHQIYLEFLSEHGLFGTIIVLSLFIFVFFKMLKIIILNRNNIQIACFCYLVSIFLPLIPSGSFFTDFNSTLFWINFSIFFAVSKESNIFKLK